jgi:endonuclease YncB( thermonuclease family)
MNKLSLLTASIAVLLPTLLSAETLTIAGPLEVLDGDTLAIGLVQIRLFGIDAPEANQRCALQNGREWACGHAATRFLRGLTDNGDLECLPASRDPYGRIVSSCSVSGRDLGTAMVESGLAWAYTDYSDLFIEQENIARAAGIGVFQAPSQTAWEYRENAWERAVEASPNGCPIKGNINGETRVYHTPWSPNYGQTKIDTSKNERWFCNEAEALAAGWIARR